MGLAVIDAVRFRVSAFQLGDTLEAHDEPLTLAGAVAEK
jgi:hypothetical protein